MERAVLVCDSTLVLPVHLPQTLHWEGVVLQDKQQDSLEDLVQTYEKNIIVNALMLSKGNQLNAAQLLKTTQRIIGYKIKNYGIDPTLFK